MSSPDNALVCELNPEEFVPGFDWYELDLDADGYTPSSLARGHYSYIGASQATDLDEVLARLDRAASLRCDYLLFETTALDGATVVSEAQTCGVGTIASYHRSEAVDCVDDLMTDLSRLATTGADMIKLVYPARTAYEIGLGLTALALAQQQLPCPVSLTPDGTWWGRVAAGMAGSALVFACASPAAWRPTVYQFRSFYQQLTTAPAETTAPLRFHATGSSTS